MILLHSSPLINGYHFVFHLHLPVCIVAAPAVADSVANYRSSKVWLASLAALALFIGNFELTARCIRDVRTTSATTHSDYLLLNHRFALEDEPAGLRVGCARPVLGNIIPAFTQDRVYVGHWFMTPEYHDKAESYAQVVKALQSGDASAERVDPLRAFLNANHIRYLIVSANATDLAKTMLGAEVEKTIEAGAWGIVVRTETAGARGQGSGARTAKAEGGGQ